MFARSLLRMCGAVAANRTLTVCTVGGVACAGTMMIVPRESVVEARGLPRWMKSTRTRFDNFASDGKLTLVPFIKALLCLSPTFKPEHNPPKLNPNAAATLFNRVDANGDGLVNFQEFAMLIALLDCPLKDMEILFKMYDFDHSGSIEKDEFVAVAKTLLDNPKIDVSEAVGVTWPNGIINQLFGSKESVSWAEVKSFVESLKKEVDHVEFCQYDINQSGKLTAEQFLHMLSRSVSGYYLPPDIVNSLLHFSKSPEDESITEPMWSTFSRLMNMNDELGRVIQVFTRSGVELTKADFKRAVGAASGAELSDADVDLVFTVFDVNGDGTLEYDEFMSVMRAKRISRN